ncbi:3'-5' exonuclease [Umezawaea beigongshangensis]|uniref:3'-5' exonuclease n=1 Tax=Umezawaea beigongshangensis TaxID=2780383 RepID=UPI001E454E7A|nr:3'-5' exonuclease [Umezawaea beigongshangensis]
MRQGCSHSQTLDKLSTETDAQVTVSTAHAAKGREWSTVRIAEDFPEPVNPKAPPPGGDPLPGQIDHAEARSTYVAATRARHRLDLGGLSWINQHPDGNPAPTPSPAADRDSSRPHATPRPTRSGYVPGIASPPFSTSRRSVRGGGVR